MAQAFRQSLFVHLPAPLSYHDRGDSVPDQVRHGHRLAHE
jgi:hypothetical protein